MELSELKKFVLEKRDEGKLVVAILEGYASIDVGEFIKQPVDGILYDLNRLEETTLTFIDKPEYGIKWVNDFAVALTIRALQSSLAEARGDSEMLVAMLEIDHSAFVAITEQLNEHPEDYERACLCATCRSYGD